MKETSNPKSAQLGHSTTDNTDQALTTNQGLKINNDQDSLTAGERGPSLLEDFILREKITHFDHERIPERIVHARGSGAHGVFKIHKSLAKYTKAKFLAEEGKETPVFVRFSTVAGSAGSTDLARDVRGFAIKFYTEEGNYDLVGNNIPVFFIQDAIKFPDLIHAVKPEPDNAIPQAASAHDTFWDFISLMPESMHMIMWAMSDRAIPRSYRMMEGFGVHTFKFINEEGKMHFVKFHFKPKLGVHSVAWDEATKISGKDSDFHRRDLWEAIENGAFPEWDFGVQIIPEEDEHKFDFDLLDPTKLIPEEEVPVELVGTLTLNRNPDNFFAETEQIAFHPGHLVPGIDFTNDPLLQGRLFSYTDTQLSRLGSPNFHEIPINRSINTVHNNQRDGHMRQEITKGKVSYEPNSIGGGCPFQAMMKNGGFASQEERVDGKKVRARSQSFVDHYSQAKLFYNSQSEPEKTHLQNALIFELSKVTIPAIRERVVGQLNFINKELAAAVAKKVGVKITTLKQPNGSIPADADPKSLQSPEKEPSTQISDALSMKNTVKDTIKSRIIGFIIEDGVQAKEVNDLKSKLEKEGAVVQIIAGSLSAVKADDGTTFEPKHSLTSTASVCFDALYIGSGKQSAENLLNEDNKPGTLLFVNEAYKHCKAIYFGKGTEAVYDASNVKSKKHEDPAIITADQSNSDESFIKAVAQHRIWELEKARNNPA
ncbi:MULTISPECIES: catalase [Chryseobacterium]|uniref:Catalase n=1 Tax=Chryseobacterium camelliae TaxID=1265445 RepID=A0ABU0TI31_9FLAO|nr:MULTISPECIES: catalase [Chryseobacterium]MDT3409419.1 catalase [Pseudacidovorax intermedius]MDQ1096716.1 catalase [Chryseobacterium camelliae]MDQ1100660.1 catalase [Chryseobacterium sp. SORGH_AS_1048]MDR6087998.1 catalase [Chryseobacterium sp. SORGH_AS_0909]MDR6132373.1 catalase [Chryseobacterium sp. SORGH_AS_1175]